MSASNTAIARRTRAGSIAAAAPALRARGARRASPCSRAPAPDPGQHDYAQQCEQRKPCDAFLPQGDHDERRKQRTDRGADIAADLEYRLGESMCTAGGHARDAGGFGVKHARAGSDQRCGEQQQPKIVCGGEQQQAAQREAHAHRQRVGLGFAIREPADDGLQE